MSQRSLLLITVFLLLSANGVSAQCTLKLVDLPGSPELRGFRLGMTKEEVKTRVPQVKFAADNDVGVSKTTINPDFDPSFDKSTFNGLRSVSLDFLDSRLTSLWLGYDSSFKWKSVEAFVEGISESLKLPAAWQAWRVRGQQLRCVDFQITVNIVAEGVSFRIVDQSAEELIAERRAAREEERASAEEEQDGTAEVVLVIADKRTKIYFTTDCPLDRQIEVNDLVRFQTADQAERAGYKKSKSCPQ